MYYTDNPLADFNRYDAEQERKRQQLPKCYECGEPLTDDWCYEIDGEYICEECLNNNHRKRVENIK